MVCCAASMFVHDDGVTRRSRVHPSSSRAVCCRKRLDDLLPLPFIFGPSALSQALEIRFGRQRYN